MLLTEKSIYVIEDRIRKIEKRQTRRLIWALLPLIILALIWLAPPMKWLTKLWIAFTSGILALGKIIIWFVVIPAVVIFIILLRARKKKNNS